MTFDTGISTETLIKVLKERGFTVVPNDRVRRYWANVSVDITPYMMAKNTKDYEEYDKYVSESIKHRLSNQVAQSVDDLLRYVKREGPRGQCTYVYETHGLIVPFTAEEILKRSNEHDAPTANRASSRRRSVKSLQQTGKSAEGFE